MNPITARRAVLYSRVSTKAQATEGVSLDAQEAMARERCAREGWMLEAVYTDVMSGRKDARPELARLMADAKAGAFEVVIVYRTDRLARSTLKTLQVAGELNDLGVRLVSLTQPIDLAGAMGRMMLATMAGFAEMESEATGERVRAARRHIALTEKRLFSVMPFGYRKEPDGSVVPHEETAPWVRWIFEEAAAGTPLLQIASRLNAEGIKKRFDTHWTTVTLRVILTSPTYLGLVTCGRNPNRRDSRGKLVRVVVKDYLTVKGSHAPLVSEELWRRANEVTGQTKGRPPRTSGATAYRVWLDIVYCGLCGRRMRVTTAKKCPSYVCPTRLHGGVGGCSARGMSERILGRHLAPAMSEALEAWREEAQRPKSRPKAPKVSAEARIAKLREDIEAEGQIYRARAQSFDQMLKNVQALEARIEALMKGSPTNEGGAAVLRAFKGNFNEAWEHADTQAKSKLVRTLVRRVTLNADNLELVWRDEFHGELGEGLTVARVQAN